MEETDPALTALCEETRRCREAGDHAGACDAAAAGIRETAGQPQPVEFPFLFLQGLAQRRGERLAPAAESFAAQLTQLKEIPEAQRNQAVWLPATLVQLSEMRDCLLDAGPELAPRAAEVRKQLVVALGADTRQGGAQQHGNMRTRTHVRRWLIPSIVLGKAKWRWRSGLPDMAPWGWPRVCWRRRSGAVGGARSRPRSPLRSC
jgi:hypothetical protein